MTEEFERAEMDAIRAKNSINLDFKPGDTIKVSINIKEGAATDRIQTFEGLVIGINKKGISSSVLVRKISYGIGVEKRFQIYAPTINGITVVKKGVVRRAKLYYIRKLKGKAARIREKIVNKKNPRVREGRALDENKASNEIK